MPNKVDRPDGTTEVLNPGDHTSPDAPGAGENVCPVCKGSGRFDNRACANCGGTGKIIEGIGGG